MQQKFFNPTSHNSEILIIWHLGRVVPRPEVLLFTRKTASLMKKAHLRDIFKKAYKSVCT
jgi:hypothetical protein